MLLAVLLSAIRSDQPARDSQASSLRSCVMILLLCGIATGAVIKNLLGMSLA